LPRICVKIKIFEKINSLVSFINERNKRGPRVEPCAIQKKWQGLVQNEDYLLIRSEIKEDPE
jgi:hypothetical protein